MRLGIDYRLLASPQNLVNRGIGRYTQQQLRHVLALDAENEYLLLCPPGADIGLVLAEIRAAANLTVHFGPAAGAGPPADPLDRRGSLRRAAEYQDWIASLGVDVYHATAPFVLDQTAPPTFDACPMVATVYDFIPLVFPSQYLHDDRWRAAYAAAAHMVASASRILAISDGTRDGAANYLGFPREAIDRAWPFADACFRPLPDDVVEQRLRALGRRVRLPERFVLTVTALHHSKNLELLLAAYGQLSPSFRRSLPLVLSCHLHKGAEDHLRRAAEAFGVVADVVLTGYVTDDELAALYNRATLVVHPSRYEGFGLPVVEAMQCGSAVVATTAPSLPEVAGRAAELVDPDDPAGLAAAIVGLDGDADRRRAMGEAGLERAARFTPEALARATLDSYGKTAGRPAGRREARRVAVCTGHPTVALGALQGDGEVELFTQDDDVPVPGDILDRFPTHHVTALSRCHAAVPFDLIVHDVEAGFEPSFPPGVPRQSVLGTEAERPVPPRSGTGGEAPPLGLSKLCEVEDFGHPALLEALTDLGAGPTDGTVGWCAAMAVVALTAEGALRAGVRVLTLGVDAVDVAFFVNGRGGEVTAAGPWLEPDQPPAARAMVVDPAFVARRPFDRARLAVRPADMCRLLFPDGSFDAVVSCRATDALPESDLAPALVEMARVVRPGGLVTLSVTVRLHGPASGVGVPLPTLRSQLARTGLEAIEPCREQVSAATMARRRRLSVALAPERQGSEDPLTVFRGALFGCVHLTLRKPGGQASG